MHRTIPVLILLAAFSTLPAHAEPRITFLDADAGRAAIVDESLEPYLSLLQPMEMSAKTGKEITGDTLDAQRAECGKRYQNAVGEFTDDERAALSWYVERIDRALGKDYPLFTGTPWSFLKVGASIEGGMPFTHGTHILFSPAVLRDLVTLSKSRTERDALKLAGELLVHEQSHVVQRLHPAPFAKLFHALWGFERAERIEEGAWLAQHRAVDPDGVDGRWVFPFGAGGRDGWLLPAVVFRDGPGLRRMPQDFLLVGLTLEKSGDGFKVKTDADGKPVSRPLPEIAEYASRFPPMEDIYHPNEAAAAIFAQLFAWDALKGKERAPEAKRSEAEQALAPMRKAFAEFLRGE